MTTNEGRSVWRRTTTALALLLSAALLSGCGPTLGDLPLPGSGVSGDTITVKIRFDEALNLAQGAAVKVNGVNSGRVQDVTTEDFRAIAVIKLRTSAQLRKAATARLRYTTPLGELFVDVTNPAQGPLMTPGEELAPNQASTAPTVEDALASASLLINGGGLAQLQVVTSELNKAIGGREETVRRTLERSAEFVRGANATTEDFLRAMDALARLSKTLQANERTINEALRDVRPAARVLRQNTPGLTKLLAEVSRFASTANNVVGSTREDLLQLLDQVTPVADEFLSNRTLLAPSLAALIQVGRRLDSVIPGDYASLLLQLQLEDLELPTLGGPVGGTTTPRPAPSNPLGGITGILPGLTNPLGGLLGGSGATGDTDKDSSGGLLSGLLGGNR